MIVTGYRGEQIEAHFRDGAEWGVEIEYSPPGRPGRHRPSAAARPRRDRPARLSCSPGETSSPTRANYPALLDTFARRGPDGLISVNWVEDPCNGAAVYVDDDHRIQRIVEKPAPGTATTHWNNAGIAVFRPMVFEYAATIGPSPRGEYEIPDAVTAMLEDGLALYAFPLQGFWSDVGTPEDLQRAARALSRDFLIFRCFESSR